MTEVRKPVTKDSGVIKSNLVRHFYIQTKKGDVYTIVYRYDPSSGLIRYGGVKFSCTQKGDHFRKKQHRQTALERYKKYPVFFAFYYVDGQQHSQVLHEVRECIKVMAFRVGLKCRHLKDKAMTTEPFDTTIIYRSNNRKVRAHVTIECRNKDYPEFLRLSNRKVPNSKIVRV